MLKTPRRHHSNPEQGFTDRHKVRDFLNFVGPGSVRFKIGPMPVGSSPWILGPEFSLIKLKKDRKL